MRIDIDKPTAKALLKDFYNFCMEEVDGKLREENIYLYLKNREVETDENNSS